MTAFPPNTLFPPNPTDPGWIDNDYVDEANNDPNGSYRAQGGYAAPKPLENARTFVSKGGRSFPPTKTNIYGYSQPIMSTVVGNMYSTTPSFLESRGPQGCTQPGPWDAYHYNAVLARPRASPEFVICRGKRPSQRASPPNVPTGCPKSPDQQLFPCRAFGSS